MRSALGKGLDALISQDTLKSVTEPAVTAATTKSVATLLPIDQIRANPNQPRRDFDEASLAELAASIKKNGILQPIVVSKTDGGFEIIAGERRWRASQRAGLKEIPAVVRSGTDAERFELALIENLQREDLNPIDLAYGYKRLQDEFQMTQEAIAESLGKDRSVIANTLRFLTLSPTIQSALRAGAISAGHAKALLSVENPAEREALFTRITTESLTVRVIEQVARSEKKKLIRDHAASSGYDAKPAEVRALEEELQRLYGRKVEIHAGTPPSHKGSIKLEFYSLDDFDALMAQLRKA